MNKRKTVRPGVHEISPVSIYGEVYGGKDLRKRCVLSLEWKREAVIYGDLPCYPNQNQEILFSYLLFLANFQWHLLHVLFVYITWTVSTFCSLF